MPELPEVENVKRSLAQTIDCPQVIRKIHFYRSDLRFKMPMVQIKKTFEGQSLLGFQRRSKYLLFETNAGKLVSHLGMTGHWRYQEPSAVQAQKHDHISIEFKNNDHLIYNDPRRFGAFDYLNKDQKLSEHPFFKHLGVEPLDDDFSAEYLFLKSRHKTVPLKTFLMDARIVVGIGNIYASEILFDAQLSPKMPAGRLKQTHCLKIMQSAVKILEAAIEKGGSTIDDYRNIDGKEGGFQQTFKVYGRQNQFCFRCGGVIAKITQSGRSTFFCKKCQPGR